MATEGVSRRNFLSRSAAASAGLAVSVPVTQAAASFEAGLPNATIPSGGFGGPPVQDFLADGVASIDDALAASEVTVSATYTQPIKNHNAMEPHSTVAVWRDGHVTVYSGCQAPIGHAALTAAAVGLDPARVHVVSPHVGGGFGNKAPTWAHTFLTMRPLPIT